MITAAEIRDALEERYPEVTDLEFNLAESGIAHEHPLIAIGVVLISSIVIATTDPLRLVEYTRYSERFVRAVAANMRISGLWSEDKMTARTGNTASSCLYLKIVHFGTTS